MYGLEQVHVLGDWRIVSWGPHVVGVEGGFQVNRLMGSGHMETSFLPVDRQTDGPENIKHYLPTNYGNNNASKETILSMLMYCAA